MSKKRMDILDSISMPFKICGQKTKCFSYIENIFIHLNLIYRYICIYKVSANLFKMLKCDSFIEIIRGLEWDQWLCYFAAHVQISCNSSALVSSLTMWGTFVLATSSMAASAIDLATSVSMAPLWDSSSSTTLDVNRTLKVDSTRWFPNTAEVRNSALIFSEWYSQAISSLRLSAQKSTWIYINSLCDKTLSVNLALTQLNIWVNSLQVWTVFWAIKL